METTEETVKLLTNHISSRVIRNMWRCGPKPNKIGDAIKSMFPLYFHRLYFSWSRTRYSRIPQKPGKGSFYTKTREGKLSDTKGLLKTLEHVEDTMIKSRFPIYKLIFKQNAFIKGRSVETALYDIDESFNE